MRAAIRGLYQKQPVFLAAAVALCVVILFFAVYKLTESPPVWYDEGIYTQDALNIAWHGASEIQTAPGVFQNAWGISGGFPFILPITFSYLLFGPSVLSGRAVMAIFMLLFAIASVTLLYKLYGAKSAIGGLVLLATFPVFYADGKNVIGEVPGLLCMALFLLALVRIERKKFDVPVPFFFLAGLLAGLCAVTKPLFLLLPLAVALVGLAYYKRIPWKLGWFVGASLGFVAVLAIHVLIHLHGISLATVLGHYSNPYGIAGGSLLGTIFSNLLRFVRESSPAYCALVCGIWFVSVAWRLYKREHISLAEQIALVFSLLVLAAFLRTPGWYRYFFTANVLGLLFLPSAIFSLGFKRVAIGVVVVLVLIQSYQLLFNSWVADHNNSHTTALLERQFSKISATSTLFFIDVPETVLFAPHNQYYQYIVDAPGLTYGTDELPLLSRNVPDEVILNAAATSTYASFLTGYKKQTNVAGYLFLTR